MKYPWSKKKEVKPETDSKTPLNYDFDSSRSYIIPTWELKQNTKRDFRYASIRVLESRFRQKTAIDKLITRQLLARDLGLRSWRTPPQIAEEKALWINHRLQRQQFIAITGIIQLSRDPKVSSMAIRMGSSGAMTLGMFNLDELYSILPIIKKLEVYREDDELFTRFGKLEDIRMAAYLSEPIVFEDETMVYITVESPNCNKTGDRLMLSGFVTEPMGMTLA